MHQSISNYLSFFFRQGAETFEAEAKKSLAAAMANDSSSMWQTMSIASAGESVVRSGPRRAAGASSGTAGRTTGLFVGDIQGAAPRSKQRNRAGPTDLTLRTDDVSGAAPATLHKTYQNKPDFALNTHDIDGACSSVAATGARSLAEIAAVIAEACAQQTHANIFTGAYAAKNTYQSQRHSNPLVPNYDWDKPSAESKPRATVRPE